MGPEEQLITIIPADTLTGCKLACLDRPQCAGFSGVLPFNGVCGIWSVGAGLVNLSPSGMFFYDKSCLVPGTTLPNTVLPPSPPTETPKYVT